MILLPQKWKRQPTVPMVVDWNHPLAQDLREFGYALPGLVPYSAVAAGSQQPFVTGAGTQDATANGPAITVNGTGNYIDLGRNISAPTQVASGFVRSTYHGVATNYLAAAESGSVWVGHRLRAGASGVVEARWSDGGGQSAINMRRGLTPSAILTSGEAPFSLAFVCRGATDWSLYKNGSNQGALTYDGTASTYSAGTLNGRINFNAGGEYGQQSASTWGYWGRALNDGEMRALHEAPFQLLVKRQRRIWVGSATGGKSFPFRRSSFQHMLVR